MTARYPGSKMPIKTFSDDRTPNTPTQPEEFTLGEGKTMLVQGKPKQFYTVGSLAASLNRRSVTIRKWEAEGVIPNATYFKPAEDKRGRRRLYTEEQILGLRELAKEEGLLEPNGNGKWKAVGDTKFKERALALFIELEGK